MSDNIGFVGCDIQHCPFTLSYRKPVHRGYCSGGGPIHARVPIHAHPQFS